MHATCREFAKLVEANAVAKLPYSVCKRTGIEHCRHPVPVPCREFAKLVEANAVAKLPDSDFEVDPGLRDIIEAQIKQEEDAVRQVSYPLQMPLYMSACLCKVQWLLSCMSLPA